MFCTAHRSLISRSFPPRISSELSICYATDSARESRLRSGLHQTIFMGIWLLHSISSLTPHLLPGKIEFTISADLVANTDKRVSLSCSLLALLLLRYSHQKRLLTPWVPSQQPWSHTPESFATDPGLYCTW